MNMTARRGRRVIKYRRLDRQVLAITPRWRGRFNDFRVLYWEPKKHGLKPNGVK